MADMKYNVLLVEDDKLDQKAFERFVEKEGLPYNCSIAGSVTEAREVLSKSSFDVIVSDYSLGDGCAVDVMDIVKDTPVILVTGAGDEEVAVKVWQAGAYDYLTKDVDRGYLKALPITVKNAVRHKRTKDRLRLLSEAIKSTDDSVYITDMDDKIIFVNRAFCQIYGYAEEEIVGQNGSVLWISNNATQNTRSVFQTRAIGSSWEVGFYHRRKDGSIFPLSLSRSIIKDEKGYDMAVVGVGRDISERILVEDELRSTNTKLERQNRIVNEMAIQVADSMKLLLEGSNLDGAKKLISEFHDLLSINANKAKLDRKEFNIETAVSNVVESLMPLAMEKGVELTALEIDPELEIRADYTRIKQIFHSLLHRAVCSTDQGGHVQIKVGLNGNEIMVEVHDDAPTMDDTEIRKVLSFSGCIRAQNPRQTDNLDLGPAIAKELIEMHGGKVWAKSSGEQGNAICFTFPRPHLSHKDSACTAQKQ